MYQVNNKGNRQFIHSVPNTPQDAANSNPAIPLPLILDPITPL